MPLNVAMPLLHKGNEENYASFYNNIGNNVLAFREPVRLEAGAAGSDKLEIDFRDDLSEEVLQEAKTLYAMLPGTLSIQEQGDQMNLVIEFRSPDRIYPDPPRNRTRIQNRNLFMQDWDRYLEGEPGNDHDTLSWLYRFNKSTMQFKKIVYFRVDPVIVREKISQLLSSNAYRQFLTNNAFLHTRVRVEGRNKSLLQAIQDDDNVIDSFMNGNSTFPVNAGMAVGGAGNDFSLGFYDGSDYALNPVYLFRLLLKWRNFSGNGEASWVNFHESYAQEDFLNINCFHGDCVTAVDLMNVHSLDSSANNLDHPLLWLFRRNTDEVDYLQHLHAPMGRYVYVDGERIQNTEDEDLLLEPYWQLFAPPAQDVNRVSDHQNNDISLLTNYDRPDGVPEAATHEWRVTDAGYIVYRRKVNDDNRYPFHDEAYFSFTGISSRVIRNAWDEFSNVTNSASDEFNVSCEMLIAMVATESGGEERACALEPLPNADLNVPCNTTPYSDYCTLTHCAPGEGFCAPGEKVRRACLVLDDYRNVVVQSTHQISAGIIPVPGYTWANLLADVDADHRIAARISPGLVQQLLSTAEVDLLQNYSAEINNIDGVENILVQNRTYADVFDWLLTGEHSIALAAAYVRHRIDTRNTGDDPFKQRIAYFAGSVVNDPDQLFGYRASSAILNGHPHSSSFLSYYNACIHYFNHNIDDADFTQPNNRLQSV